MQAGAAHVTLQHSWTGQDGRRIRDSVEKAGQEAEQLGKPFKVVFQAEECRCYN